MKRTLSLLLVLLMITAAVTVVPFSEAVAASKTVISNLSPAVTGNAGESIDLSKFSVQLSDGTVLESPVWKQDGNTVTTVKFDKKGVYNLTAEQNGKKRTVYAVIKNASDTEYVLYENNFDTAADISGLTKVANGTTSVKDGKLVMDTTGKSNTILLMPSWLGDFGNYNIETSAAMISSTDASRWFSICYRYQGGQYMHMCVRKNMATPGGDKATGGVECVGNDGGWKYLLSAGYEQNMEYGTYYKFAVSMYNNTVQYTVDNSVVVHIDDISKYGYNLKTLGTVGLQGNSSVMNFDYIKVTVATEAATKPEVKDPLISVTHNATNLLNAVTNVAIVKEADLDKVLGASVAPNSVLVEFAGVTAQKLDNLLAKCKAAGVIPGLYVSNSNEATTVVDWCSKNDFWDINIASSNGDVLKTIRNKKPALRTILYLENVSGKSAQQVREIARKYAVNVLMLPSDLCSKAFVDSLQELHVCVWTKGTNINKINAAWMIASGAQGMVSDNHTLIHTVMKDVFGKNTLTKTPSIIGHRGNPSQAPENSIQGYVTAVKNGATEVETDIYLTKDGEIIIMHDSTLNRTTNYTGTKSVTQMTLAEIRQYKLLNKDGSVSNEPVPTLKEMFEALKNDHVYYVIELKSGDENMVEPLYKLIKQYGVQDRVNIISFSGPVLKKTYDVDPIISAGYLSGSLTTNVSDRLNFNINVFELIKAAQLYNASVNINYAKTTKEFYQHLNDRGITLWPWTFNSGSSMAFYNGFLWGFDGLTTDDAQLTKNTVKDFKVSLGANNGMVKPGEKITFTAESVTYNDTVSNVNKNTSVVWLTNDLGITVDTANGEIKAGNTEGTASFMLSFSTKLPNNKQYVLYSQPITISVSEDGNTFPDVSLDPEVSVIPTPDVSEDIGNTDNSEESVNNESSNVVENESEVIGTNSEAVNNESSANNENQTENGGNKAVKIVCVCITVIALAATAVVVVTRKKSK